MPTIMDLELANATYKVVKDLIKIKPEENLLITVDSATEWRVAEETAKAGNALGAKIHLAYHSTPRGYGKVADKFLPDSLKEAIPNTDAWIEYNNQWLLYSTPWEKAMEGRRVRYLFLGGLNTDQMVRCIGKIDLSAQTEFQNKIVEMTHLAKHMRITTLGGTDISFENDPNRPITNELTADVPGPHFLLGQIGWAPIEESINGKIVFDGSFSGGGEADLGILKEPIEFILRDGKVVEILGGEEAKILKQWLEKLNDPRMYNAVHVCYGFNPGARLSGLCTEDERVWGSTEWGFGYQGPMFKGKLGDATSHADGICLNSSVWMDEKLIMDKGKIIDPELKKLSEAVRK
ncbi:MAG TPA: leucyl aminopeptidase [Thermoplasmata archaeon]|nr:leucyl aminopeptidase [Thermoplasmata archaeon]